MEHYKFTGLSYSQRLNYGAYQFLDHFFGRQNVFKLFRGQRRSLFRGIRSSLQKKGEGKLIPIERRKDLSREEFTREYIHKGIPVVLEGAAKDWDCCKKWSMQYLKDLHGDDDIVLVDQNRPLDPYEKIKLRDVIDNIREGGSKYYRFYPLFARHPEHMAECDFKWLRSFRHKFTIAESTQCFIGGKGTETAIHNAYPPNLFVMAHGEKEWVIYPPYYTAIVDPDPVRNIYRSAPYKAGYPFNPFNPDYKSYELYKHIDGYHVHLKQGDILWNPPYWWHTVKNLTDSIGFGYRWVPPLYCFKIAPLYFTLDMLCMNPPVWETIKLFKKDFNLLQLAETGRLKEYLAGTGEK